MQFPTIYSGRQIDDFFFDQVTRLVIGIDHFIFVAISGGDQPSDSIILLSDGLSHRFIGGLRLDEKGIKGKSE